MRMPPPPQGEQWKLWGERLVSYLTRIRDLLSTRTQSDNPSQDGVLLWDRAGYPVVSKDGEFRQIVLADGYAQIIHSGDVTASTTNTAEAIGWDALTFSNGLSLDPTDDSKIIFEEAGTYLLSFTVQLLSNSSSAKNAWFFPRINGVDVVGSTIRVTMSANTEYLVMSRTAIFPMTAGSYLQAMWAVDDVDLTLSAPAATAFAPSSPSVTLSITRLRQ